MSHFSLLLITPTDPTELEIEQHMAPFYEAEGGNENAKWDWYQIGGRWSGLLVPDYDPQTDPNNQEKCSLCKGTGMRNDAQGREARVKDPSYRCNGCNGKGERVKWPTQWIDVGNKIQVKDLNPKVQLNTFAYLRDGQWVESGQMGWWGVVRNKKEDDDWEKERAAVLASLNPTDWITVIDCHI